MKPKKSSASDLGNEHLYKHRAMKPEKLPGTFKARMRVVDGNELDRLLFLGDISNEQWSIGDRFISLCRRAGVTGVQAQNYQRTSRVTGDLSERQATDYAEMSSALAFVRDHAGERNKRMLLGLALEELRFTSKSVPALRRSLDILGRFFGQ